MKSYWQFLSGHSDDLHQISFSGPEKILPSVFDVSGFASDVIAIANLATAELKAARMNSTKISSVKVDRVEACAAFRSEALLKGQGWEIPAAWDPIAGDYMTANGWIRLHTNYSYHLQAVLNVLKVSANREEVSSKVASLNSEELEKSVVEAGGCAAVLRDYQSWQTHFHGEYAVQELPIFLEKMSSHQKPAFGAISSSEKPLSGIRVLDLTRVIAGPECTRFLSSQGADVLRIDPHGFAEVAALLPETTVGKRCAFLDISTSDGKKVFEALLREAHVLVHGLRPGALDKLGFTRERVSQINSSLVIATMNAYGWHGPWKHRRGFDSLVQMSTGIAAAGALAKNSSKPYPLPAQALDHGTGFLLAAGVCRALTELYKNRTNCFVKGSLVGAANILLKGPSGNIHSSLPEASYFESAMIDDMTYWGPVRRVRPPGEIDGEKGQWIIPAAPLGTAKAEF
ncbi:CoA transferase [Bdellovibrio sp. BCCA]|uniref:CoA transferase n=1 Tax=Bdellovibrio sp. BCCA TaxID=3136281 RepID=UPI0030F2AED9